MSGLYDQFKKNLQLPFLGSGSLSTCHSSFLNIYMKIYKSSNNFLKLISVRGTYKLTIALSKQNSLHHFRENTSKNVNFNQILNINLKFNI